MGKIAKSSHVVDGERNEGQCMMVDGSTACFGEGELAFRSRVMNGMSQSYGMVMFVQFMWPFVS